MRLGSLCTGYGGLDLGAELALGPLEHVWHAEIDPDASKVLAAHWPDVPNLGDLRAVDWSQVEPVDVLTAGFPCQPVSAAGRRRGVDDERWIWDDIAAAVGRMEPRPRLLVLENVPGLLTANRGHAMARVVHSLAALGYVGRYRVASAADVGAAHRRERVFIVAWSADCPPDTRALAGRVGVAAAAADRVTLLPTPRAADTGTPGRRSREDFRPVLSQVLLNQLLPTPNAAQGRGTGTPSRETAERRMHEEHRRFLDDAIALLPDGPDRWGQYAPAIARWERVLGRPAPEPTEPGSKGQPRLSPRFVEWLMGLDDGWVTDHLPRNPALRVLGNGVVPQQAAAAIRELVSA